MTKHDSPKAGPANSQAAQARERRQAEQLRANLLKRKSLMRQKAQNDAGSTGHHDGGGNETGAQD